MRVWSRARIHLRLSEREFWASTPRQLQYLWRAHEESLAHSEYLTGLVASAVMNFSMSHPEKRIEPHDLFGTRWARKRSKAVKDPEQVGLRAFHQLRTIMIEQQAQGRS